MKMKKKIKIKIELKLKKFNFYILKKYLNKNLILNLVNNKLKNLNNLKFSKIKFCISQI